MYYLLSVSHSALQSKGADARPQGYQWSLAFLAHVAHLNISCSLCTEQFLRYNVPSPKKEYKFYRVQIGPGFPLTFILCLLALSFSHHSRSDKGQQALMTENDHQRCPAFGQPKKRLHPLCCVSLSVKSKAKYFTRAPGYCEG